MHNKRLKACIAVNRTPCHSYGVSLFIWDHITQCYLPPDTSEHTRLNPSQTGWYLICLPWRDGRLSWPSWLVTYRDGLPPEDGHPSK